MAPVAFGANTTPMVQLAPTARPAPQDPPEREYLEPALKVKVPPAKATLPVLVTVTLIGLLVVPVAQLPKANGLGATLADRTAATPVPVRLTGEPVTGTLAVIVTVPLAVVVFVGVNTTLMEQLAPAFKVAPQLPPDRENGAVTTTAMVVAWAPPLFVSVRVCAALVVPTTVPLNVSEVGDTLRTANAGTMNSTAPASTALFAFLAFPKKSASGASL